MVADRETRDELKWLLAASTAALILHVSSGAHAFECPKRFGEAQAAIDKVSADLKGAMGGLSKEQSALVHALVDDAKQLLSGTKHNHEKPQGLYDNARSVARATAALGHAEAAGLLVAKY